MSAFDLRNFAPAPDVTFMLRKHGDHVFAVDADPDVDDIARMLRIENAIRRGEDGEPEAAMLEGKQMLLQMIQERQPDVTDLRIGGQEIVVIFSLILHGDTVAQAVLDAITQANADEPGKEPSSAFEHPERGGGAANDDDPGDGPPLPSAKHSSAASSSSDERDGSRLAIGTG